MKCRAVKRRNRDGEDGLLDWQRFCAIPAWDIASNQCDELGRQRMPGKGNMGDV